MSFSSSSSSGSARKKDVVVVVVVVSDVLKDDEGGFDDDDPVVARLPRLDDFWTRLLLLDISKLKVLFPRHHRDLAVASPSSSSPLLSPSARRNRLAGVLYAKGGSKVFSRQHRL